MQNQRNDDGSAWSAEEIEAVRETAKATWAIGQGLPADSAMRRNLMRWNEDLEAFAERLERELELHRDVQERRRELDDGYAAWDAMPAPERDRLACELIDDRGGLTPRELRLALRELPGSPLMGEGDVRTVLKRLMREGGVEREPEPFPKGPRFRYRYFLRRPLEGPIADLERAFCEDAPDVERP